MLTLAVEEEWSESRFVKFRRSDQDCFSTITEDSPTIVYVSAPSAPLAEYIFVIHAWFACLLSRIRKYLP